MHLEVSRIICLAAVVCVLAAESLSVKVVLVDIDVSTRAPSMRAMVDDVCCQTSFVIPCLFVNMVMFL